MTEFLPESEDVAAALANYPSLRRANMIARKLEEIVREAGDNIAQGVFRRAREAVVRAQDSFINDDESIARMIDESLESDHLPEPVRRRPLPDIGIPEDPRSLFEFSQGLNESDLEELFHADPFLGNREGLPREYRYKFNARNLDMLYAKAGNNPTASLALDDITKILYTPRRGDPDLGLAYVDEYGHFALDLDNPDYSDHTAIILNPAGPVFEPTNYADESMSQIRQIAMAVSPRERTAVTVWAGYENPHSMIQSIFPQFAQDGADMARQYHEGLRVTHVGDPSHNTTLGHSYAGVLAGHMAGNGAVLDTDDMVAIGSWGMGVRNVAELRLAGVEAEEIGEHMFATMAKRDYTQLMPHTHGTPPNSPGFGAKVFASSSDPGLPRWVRSEHSAAHYLGSHNPAAGKLGLIITGLGELVR